ncbi:MAG: tRNA epoxyqueuosine(34) reductase QueG [Acidobacteriota bacterium]|nr:tRNA epoxyqueuosine(34) reductase QueG [Acidobacteriota bacterium]
MRERHNRSMDDRQGLGPGISAEVITRCGKAAGLTTCGVADCGPSDHGSWLDRWLSAGAHGSMAWMERTAAIRKELTSKWDWARSALVGTVSYLTEPVDRRRLPGIGPFIARYARGRDYHDLLRERLADWCEAIEKAAGRSFRRALLVDTSAILERELALRAGLGWIGKNTCLIGPRGDSWRLIGVVLTDLPPLPPVPPAADRCGTCRACLDACPTGALPEPYFLDARRCISYLTIEHRGEIEAEMEPAVGGLAVRLRHLPGSLSLEPAGRSLRRGGAGPRSPLVAVEPGGVGAPGPRDLASRVPQDAPRSPQARGAGAQRPGRGGEPR